MKRYNNLYQQIFSIDNLELADMNARKGKSNQACIKRHDVNKEANILNLHNSLVNKTYKTSPYTTFIITDPKERVIYRLPYIDRIVHHAIMNIIQPIFVSVFTSDTYSCIKGRGIHAAANSIKSDLQNKENANYCLKIDVKKFYPSIDHEILKSLLRKKFKDKDLLELLDSIIDSADGLPIGNYLSQYLANFYLAYFDHWIKEDQKEWSYHRYADDMIFLSNCKRHLHNLLANIKNYLANKLCLELKKNYQVFSVVVRGIDILGYVFRPDFTKVRKSIKQGFARMLKWNYNQPSIASYLGWLKHANCINLTNKLLHARI